MYFILFYFIFFHLGGTFVLQIERTAFPPGNLFRWNELPKTVTLPDEGQKVSGGALSIHAI